MINRTAVAALSALPISLWGQGPERPPADEAAVKHTELPKVTVTADPFVRRHPVEATQAASVLTREALERARGSSLGETLAAESGVHNADFGAGSGRPVIRGQGGPRVRILNGGSAVADASSLSPDHNVALEPFRAQQIEILKGPASLLYGSGAIGGVINQVSHLIPDTRIDAPAGGFGVAAATVNKGHTTWGHVETGQGPWAVHLDGLHRNSEDYEIPGQADTDEAGETASVGRVGNSAIATQSWGLGLSWLPDEAGFFGAGLTRYKTQYGIPGHDHGHPAGEAPADEDPVTIDLVQQRSELRIERNWQDAAWQRLRASLTDNRYEHQELENDVPGTRFDNNSQEARLELTHAPLLSWRGVLGVQSSWQDFSAIGEEAVVPPVKTQAHGIFLLEEREFSRYRLSIGGRFEHLEHAPDELGRATYDLFNASSSLHFDLSESQHLRLGVSYSQRAPDVQELFSSGPHLATRSFDLGDEALNTESAVNLDLGWHADVSVFSVNLDLFHTRFSDFIFSAEVDLDGDGSADRFEAEEEEAGVAGEDEHHQEDGLLILAYQQAAARFWGGEMEVSYALSPYHRLELSGDFVRAERGDGKQLPRIPADRLGLAYRGERRSLSWGLGIRHTASQNRTAALESASQSYTFVSADLSWTKLLGDGELRLGLRGRNLLDDEARNHVSVVKTLAPLPGRNFSAELSYSF